jgi:hypothetical protein
MAKAASASTLDANAPRDDGPLGAKDMRGVPRMPPPSPRPDAIELPSAESLECK